MEDGKREMLGQQHDAVEAEEAAMMMPSTSTSKSINVDQQTTNANQSEMEGEQPQEELLVVEDNEQLNEVNLIVIEKHGKNDKLLSGVGKLRKSAQFDSAKSEEHHLCKDRIF